MTGYARVTLREDMERILCIETGTDICSVALSENGKLTALRESSGGRDHARCLAVYVDELLRENSIRPQDLSAVAVGKGPGSYTGLRIGVSFAKGMCYALGIPLVAVDSLEAMAQCAIEDHSLGIFETSDWSTALLCPMTDARRMEVYMEVFDTQGRSVSPVKAAVIGPDSLRDETGRASELLIFGNGAPKCAEVLGSEGVRLLDVSPSARGMCATAHSRLAEGLTEDIAYFEPFYLKDFIISKPRKKLL